MFKCIRHSNIPSQGAIDSGNPQNRKSDRSVKRGDLHLSAHEAVPQCEDLTEPLEDVYREPTKMSICVPQVEQEIQSDLRMRIVLDPSIVRCPEPEVVTLKVQHHLVQEPFCAYSQVTKVLVEAPVPRPITTFRSVCNLV